MNPIPTDPLRLLLVLVVLAEPNERQQTADLVEDARELLAMPAGVAGRWRDGDRGLWVHEQEVG